MIVFANSLQSLFCVKLDWFFGRGVEWRNKKRGEYNSAMIRPSIQGLMFAIKIWTVYQLVGGCSFLLTKAKGPNLSQLALSVAWVRRKEKQAGKVGHRFTIHA